MRSALLFCLLSFVSGNSENTCNNVVDCDSSENPNTCPEGFFYREKVKVHGCCPGCVRLKGENEVCSSPAECRPGYTCSLNRKCEKDPAQACEFYKQNDYTWLKHHHWNPICRPDGTFAPKQCKGEKMSGKCFCVDKAGNRIFGEGDWAKTQNMTCACSRLADEKKKTESEGSFHCDSLGNFENLQCDRKVCWCAFPKTGIPYTTMVPSEAVTFLPCYDGQKMGAQYYRQCDSLDHGHHVVKTLLGNHGTKEVAMVKQRCNFDGSYHRVQIVRDKKRCVSEDNAPLTEAVVSAGKVDCNCAFDRYLALGRQTQFILECQNNGNYRNRQTWNGKVFCVDEDGFHYSDDPKDCVPSSQQSLCSF